MIYLLIPCGVRSETEDIRLFTTYSMLETIMRRGIQSRRLQGQPVEWCFAVGYEGGDEEVRPVFIFDINQHGDIVRRPF